MPTIYHSKGPAPWKNGGMTVTQFESGLIRAEQSYYVPTATAESYLSDFSIGAAMQINATTEDGEAYIYPLPSLADQGNGFTKITVTAYGRKAGAESGTIERTYESVMVTKANLVNGDVILGPGVRCLFPVYRILRTTKKTDVPFLPNIEDLKSRDPIYRESDQQEIDPSVEFGNLKTELITSITRSQADGYGEMQEETFFVRFQPATTSE